MIFNNGRKKKKEALLEELAKEDLRVLALAYMYAKNLQIHGVDITKPISTATVNAAIWNNAYQEGYYDAMNKMRAEKNEVKTAYCKDCKYFKYDGLVKVDRIKTIAAHEICKKWGTGCKTKEDGFCFLFEPKEIEE